MTPRLSAVRAAPQLPPARIALLLGGLVFLLMMVFGLVMKASQAELL